MDSVVQDGPSPPPPDSRPETASLYCSIEPGTEAKDSVLAPALAPRASHDATGLVN
jgi:hypothetical protein